MNRKIVKYIKAIAAALAYAGIVVSPDQQESILACFLAIYAVISGAEGKEFK